MEMAIIGLGKMGKALAGQALSKGVKVFGLTRGQCPPELLEKGIIEKKDLQDLVNSMSSPRKIFLYVPAGPIVEDLISKLTDLLKAEDILIDGGNSYWGDSIRRSQQLLKHKIHFIDLGTSGGIAGALNGACFMVGGSREAYDHIAPVLEKISAPNAFAYMGPAGCGHLVKLIHNGIEFGMLQAIGEGMALLEKFKERHALDMEAVFKTYRHGSVIRSWLIDLMAQQYQEKQGLNKVPAYIEDTGEVNWLVSDAIHLEIPIPVIAHSVMELFRSRDEKRNDYKSVAMMRNGFGGHPFGPSEFLKTERMESRISPEFPEERYEQ